MRIKGHEEAARFLAKVQALQALVEAAEESRIGMVGEAKGIHTHQYLKSPKNASRRLRSREQTKAHAADPAGWNKRRKNAQTAAKRMYKKTKAQFELEMQSVVLGYLGGQGNARTMRKKARKIFNDAYERAYRLGMKAAGLGDLEAPKRTVRPIQPTDERRKPLKGCGPDGCESSWVKSALKDERQYWNKFMADVEAKNFRRFSPKQRIKMYADSLDHVYEAARVVSQPHRSIIYWKMNPEKEHCDICDFLQKHSPYTRETLPGVPRDGNTCKGLTRCGCELVVKVPSDSKKWSSLKRKNRAWLLRQIQRIRKGKTPAASPRKKKKR